MSFQSNDLDEYVKIYNNPSIGLKIIRQQKNKLKLKNDEKDIKEESDNENDNEEDDADCVLEEEEIIEDDSQNTVVKKYTEDIEFQIIDIDHYHVEDDDDKKHFVTMLFGKTKEDKSVYVNVTNFTPFFFVEIDANWRMNIIHKIMKDIQKYVYPKNLVGGLITFKIIKAHKFHGFTNETYFNFLQLTFHDHDSMSSYARAFERKHSLPYISRQRKITFKLYESNLQPILRFLHMQNVDPIGWCKISKEKYKDFEFNHRRGTTDINICCDWRDVTRHECTDMHKLKILCFDIECDSEDGRFPQWHREGDRVIQIGMTYSYLGEADCFKKVILCLKKTSSLEDGTVKCYNTEDKLLLAFTSEVQKEDPDVISGYNIFGFDFDYMKNRAKKFNIYSQFSRLSRIKGHVCKYVEQKLESSAMGRNNLKYYSTPGRICIDLMKVIQREHALNGYTLDNVAANFIRDKIVDYEYVRETENNKDISKDDDCYSSDENDELEDDTHIKKKYNTTNKKRIKYTKLKVKSTFGIRKDDFIGVYYNDGSTDNKIGKKSRVLDIEENKSITLAGKVRVRPFLKKKWDVFWCQAKDDIGPNDIFRLNRGDEKDRAVVAKYCLKDCSLCNRLMAKLQILPNSIGMGNVCGVPLSYLFLRGQGIKIFSLVAKQCREENYLIPTTKRRKMKPTDANPDNKEKEEKEHRSFQKFIQSLINKDAEEDEEEEDEGYEGATVFEPIKGAHYEPVIVGDYSSLYPSSMIMKNLSHDSIVLDPIYDNLPGYIYHQQSYNNNDGTKSTCRFAEKADGSKAIIPRILMKLLATRKKYNKMKDTEKDPFKKAVWNGLQLAYKVTANSLYGQCGSIVSPIAMRPIAACTTSIGRDMLECAKYYVEGDMLTIINLIREAVETKNDTNYLEFMRKFYEKVPDQRVADGKPIKDNDGKETMNWVYKGKEEYYQWIKREIYSLMGPYNAKPLCIYGDTDSVFFKLNMTCRKTGEPFRDHEALKISIKMGIIATGILNNTFAYPQALAYEKVYWPFVIISKKRYVGNLYSTDPDKYYQKSMGLVTKRRDNADIVKVIVGGIIDQILNHRSPIGAVNFAQSRLMKIISGQYDIEKFIISKTLKDKSAYKEWTSMAHVVLAERMGQRDAGNKPQSNDRIPYVYIEVDKPVKLQGERVEHPKYILDNNLKIDYLFYITNQIMKPSIQFLELLVENPTAIFKKYIVREENRKSGITPIMKYYPDCPVDQGNEVSINLSGDSTTNLFGCPEKTNGLNKKRIVRKRMVNRVVDC
jgi:DNA polymerase elongation subunit (family B)